MLMPQYLIIVVMMSISFFPAFYIQTINYIITQMPQHLKIADYVTFRNFTGNLSKISIYSAIFFALIGIVWLTRIFIVRKNTKIIGPTWGCGYVAPNNRMQYTGKSFSKPLGKIFNFLLIEKKQFQELAEGETFPKKRKYTTYYLDFFEFRFIDTIIQRLLYAVNYFKFIQNGRMQWYVIYGIVFILSIFILTFLNNIQ
jgi:hypothetical protein